MPNELNKPFQLKLDSMEWDEMIATNVTRKMKFQRNRNILISSSIAMILFSISFLEFSDYNTDSITLFYDFIESTFSYGLDSEIVSLY